MDTDTVLRLVRGVPDQDGFPLVDDLHARFDALAAAHPEQVTVTRIGTSRLGEPLHSYRIGTGSHTAVVVGGVHPNEPIGMVTVMTMARRLAELPDQALGVDWHFIPCADPDATRLNEGWFAGPWTREHYARHFFRPQGSAQVEWTFPFRHGDVVRTAALTVTVGTDEEHG